MWVSIRGKFLNLDQAREIDIVGGDTLKIVFANCIEVFEDGQTEFWELLNILQKRGQIDMAGTKEARDELAELIGVGTPDSTE